MHWELSAGARAEVPREYPERAAFIVSGRVEFDGKVFEPGRMLVFQKGSAPVCTAQTQATVVLIGGEPIGSRFIEWNFVSSSRERIEQAKADWRAGRMQLPQRDDQEFIPLPEAPPPPNPMS